MLTDQGYANLTVNTRRIQDVNVADRITKVSKGWKIYNKFE